MTVLVILIHHTHMMALDAVSGTSLKHNMERNGLWVMS